MPRSVVNDVLKELSVFDCHTHLFPPSFCSLSLSGLDNLLTYHYLVAEFLGYESCSPQQFFSFPQQQQAKLIYDKLFLENLPISEAARGLITTLHCLELDLEPSYQLMMESFSAQYASDRSKYFRKIFSLAHVASVVMTNDPFDSQELAYWSELDRIEDSFIPSMRLDGIFQSGTCSFSCGGKTFSVDFDNNSSLLRYLEHCIAILHPSYLAVSAPSARALLESPRFSQVVLQLAKDSRLPVFLLLGVHRAISSNLQNAGDGISLASVDGLEAICQQHPDVRFFASLLASRNQTDLTVLARVFPHLRPAGCWWYLNQPETVKAITAERFNLLGFQFIPQFSDARVVEQLLYKWAHTRSVLADVLARKLTVSAQELAPVSREALQGQLRSFLLENPKRWLGEIHER
ncbi:MAG: hypothetical protein KDD64_12195 [Bdellovibrionales bacterium]|nr:hypothetical protein [Bdellovibrionales bacterium]